MTPPVEQAALLAHLRNRFPVGPENLATEALTFILNRHKQAHDAFTRHCRYYQNQLPDIDRFGTQNYLREDGAIPDLVGMGSGRVPLIVEIKFHAPLTKNQPVTYMKRLLESDAGALLLFLVPEKRAPFLWAELKARCQNDGDCRLAEEQTGPFLGARSCSGNVRIGVTSWAAALNDLDRALTDQRGYWELQQLRSLCDHEDRQVFEPLDDSDLQMRLGRRFGEYRDLAWEVTECLPSDLIAGKGPLASSYRSVGRNFRLKGWQCWFGLHWGLWATQEQQSPLWLWIADQNAANHKGMRQALQKFQDKGLMSNDGHRYICIRLLKGADRPSVLENLKSQVEEVAKSLPVAPAAAETDTARENEIGEAPD